jgi:hypothetical protein
LKINIHTQTFNEPWWAANPHTQTIASSFFQNKQPVDYKRVEIGTSDGDFLELDLIQKEHADRCAVLFHGLEGNSSRFYVQNLAATLSESGWNVVAVNFRGCGSRLNDKPYSYHAGFTRDYERVFTWVMESLQPKLLVAAGFSLGGNALLKYLGEQGSRQPLAAAAAISPPFDLLEGAYKLQRGFNKVYDFYFIRSISAKHEEHRNRFPDIPEFKGKSLYDFDDQVTAPLHGYSSAVDYYNSNSSKGFIPEIETETLILHSMDDPICPIQYAPFDIMKEKSNIHTLFTEKGGHVAFWSREKNWLNKRIVQWFESGNI